MIDINSEEEASRLYQLAFDCEDAGDLTSAADIRRKLLQYNDTEERFLLAMARSLMSEKEYDNAETMLRKSIFIYPLSELSSLQLFHFLIGIGKTDEAFEELKRFQSISYSDDYDEIVHKINTSDKYPS